MLANTTKTVKKPAKSLSFLTLAKSVILHLQAKAIALYLKKHGWQVGFRCLRQTRACMWAVQICCPWKSPVRARETEDMK